MRKLVLASICMLALAGAAYAYNGRTVEVLVDVNPTKVPRAADIAQTSSYYAEVQNNGPNTEGCAIGTTNVDGGAPVYDDGGLVVSATAARQIAAAAAWPTFVPGTQDLWCITTSAIQVHGAATVVTESR